MLQNDVQTDMSVGRHESATSWSCTTLRYFSRPYFVLLPAALAVFCMSPLQVCGEEGPFATQPSVLDEYKSDAGEFDVAPIHGVTEPIQYASVTAPIEATVTSVPVHEGDRVSEGDVLAVLDDRVARASVEAARVAAKRTASSQLADAQVRFAESYLKRLETADKGAVSEVEVSEARASLERAMASAEAAKEELQQAKANLELEEAKLDAHTIRAPFDGHVVRVHASPGDLTTINNPIVEVANTSRLKAELFLPFDWYGKLKAGHEYTLWAGAPLNQPVRARYIYGEPRIDAASNSFRTVFEIDNHDLKFPAGFSARFEKPGLLTTKPIDSPH